MERLEHLTRTRNLDLEFALEDLTSESPPGSASKQANVVVKGSLGENVSISPIAGSFTEFEAHINRLIRELEDLKKVAKKYFPKQ